MIRIARAALILGLAAAGLAAPAAADDHILMESRRTYMGRTYPPQTSEIWIAADRSYAREGAFVTIERYDLGKRWRIDTRTKAYLEEDLATPLEPKPAAPTRVQELGWSYHPEYVWTWAQTRETKDVGGFDCRKGLLTGIAEYADESRELWLAKDVPIDMARYFERIVRPSLSPGLAAIFAKTAALRERLPIRTVVTQDPPIARRTIWETTLLKVETARPPDGIYEIPPGFIKGTDRDDAPRS